MISPIMYIFVNNNLNMSKGKITAQCCHIVQLITEEIIRSGYENNPIPKTYYTYMIWRNNPKTIILKTTENELNELKKIDISRSFIDNGELTVVGFFPSSSSTIIEITKKYKLL